MVGITVRESAMAESVDNNVFIVLVFFLAFGVQELGPEALEKYSEFFFENEGKGGGIFWG